MTPGELTEKLEAYIQTHMEESENPDCVWKNISNIRI